MNRQITADPTPLDQDAEGVPRALIVDDDPVLRLAITQFVGRLGFHTESVENGQLAVEHFDAEGADIVLLDAAMPVLDGFKAVNDSLGHAAGDEVLKTVSARLRDAVRDGDTVARIGGDEFAVLLTDIRQDTSVEVFGRRLLATMAEPIAVAGEQRRVGASIGVSLYPDHGDNGNTLMARADQAMYAVKRSGKNDICFA